MPFQMVSANGLEFTRTGGFGFFFFKNLLRGTVQACLTRALYKIPFAGFSFLKKVKKATKDKIINVYLQKSRETSVHMYPLNFSQLISFSTNTLREAFCV
jgi:flavoprotein